MFNNKVFNNNKRKATINNILINSSQNPRDRMEFKINNKFLPNNKT